MDSGQRAVDTKGTDARREAARGRPTDASSSPPSPDAGRLLALQRSAGNRAVAALANTEPAHGVVQRLNGAAPQNFRVTATAADNAKCEVSTDLDWDSSNGSRGDLADFQSREIVTFATDPRIRMPCYNMPLPFGMQLVGNVLTKPVGVMSNPGGRDTHSGAGLGTKFTMGGVPNLQRGAWQLVGTQYYQTKQNAAANWVNAAGPFTITRTMVQNGNDYELTITKAGPGCNVAAGPTPITIETSTAIGLVGAARGDQTAEWNAARNTLLNADPGNFKPALQFNQIAVDPRNSPQGVPISTIYEYTSPDPNAPVNAFTAAYEIPAQWRNTIYQKAREAVRGIIDHVLNGVAPPTRFVITIFRCAGVQQQAFKTNENGGTYRIILRADKLMDMGQWGQDVNTSMAGRESKRATFKKNKRKKFAKAVVTHEMGHLLHAHTNLNAFDVATMMPAQIPLIPALDPLREEKIHVCNVNGRIMQALAAKNYKGKWGYAQANPGEVVPEVFTAIQHRRKVPPGLAAVYVAYGGMRGGNVDVALQKIFGGAIPVINEPEDVIPIIG